MGLVPHHSFLITWFKVRLILRVMWNLLFDLCKAVAYIWTSPWTLNFSFVSHAHIFNEQPSGNETMILTHIYILRLFLPRVFNPTIASTVLRVAAAKSQNTYLTLRKKADPDPPPTFVVRLRLRTLLLPPWCGSRPGPSSCLCGAATAPDPDPPPASVVRLRTRARTLLLLPWCGFCYGPRPSSCLRGAAPVWD